MSAVLRDPAARGRATGLLVAMVVLWPLLVVAQFDPAALFDPGNLATMGGFLAQFLPPATGADFLALLGQATIDTLAIATAGVALAWLIAVPLALLSTRSLSVGRFDGRLRPASELLRLLARLVTLVLRGVPELVWALVFVRIFGLGPAAGVAALAVTYGGMLAKVYAEILESTPQGPTRALFGAGAGRLQALGYGLLPAAADELVSYTVYRWECAVRASVVMGFVGAGGLGQLMDQSMKMLNGGEACTILLTFLALVMGADALSAWLRRQLT
jgi:phosphonate transport system permease protein